MRRTALAISALALCAAGPALAWDPGPEADRRLARGQAWLEVRPDPAGASGLVRAGLEIDAPPDVVWTVMLDCQLAPRMVSNLKSCTVLERDPAGRWDLREQVAKPLLFPRSARYSAPTMTHPTGFGSTVPAVTCRCSRANGGWRPWTAAGAPGCSMRAARNCPSMRPVPWPASCCARRSPRRCRA